MNETHFIWTMDPIALHIGPVSIHWYGILFASAFIVGLSAMKRIVKYEGMPQPDLDTLLGYMLLGTVIGARLVHCFFYDPQHYLSHPLDIFKIWEGGLASHGGGIGLLLGMALYRKKHRDVVLPWAIDRIAILTALGGFFIRTANLINSEIYGRPTDVPWAIVFQRIDNVPRHPAQLYEAIGYALTFIFLAVYYRRHGGKPRPGALFGYFLVMVFSVRIAVEFVKAPQAAYEAGYAFSVGQWLSLPFIAAGLVILLKPSLWANWAAREAARSVARQ